MLRNGDKDQFKTLVDHLQNQYALGTDQFPKTTTSAADIMGAHKVRNQNEKLKREKNEKNDKIDKNDKNPKTNQRSTNNAPRGGNESSYGQNKELFCHICGEKNHLAPKCKSQNKVAYNDWYINQLKRAQQHNQQSNEKSEVEKIKEKVKINMEKGWCTFQTERNVRKQTKKKVNLSVTRLHRKPDSIKMGQ